MMAISASQIKQNWMHIREYVRFHPHTGRLWWDVPLLLLIGALHSTVLPSLTASLLAIDLMTPWLVTILIIEKIPRALLFCTLAGLILETHTTAPAGLYLCIYWMITCVIYLTRETLSWRHALPWLLTYVGAQLGVIAFETFVLAISAGSRPFSWTYIYAQLCRLLIAVGIGMLLSRRYIGTGIQVEADR